MKYKYKKPDLQGKVAAERATVLIDAGRLEQAESLCNSIISQGLEHTDMLLPLGRIRYFQQRYAESISLLRQTLDIRPNDHTARLFIFSCYKDNKEKKPMLEMACEFAKHPLNGNETLMAFRAFLDDCNWEMAETLREKAFKLMLEGNTLTSVMPAMLLDINCMPDISPELIFNLHRVWGMKTIQDIRPSLPSSYRMPEPGERMKIGYISPDFCCHSVGFFINQVIEFHDRSRFEIFCYAHLRREDSLTQKIRNDADNFYDITKLPNEEVANRIHADGIHILIDLGGHAAQSRLPVLASMPAPVQITYLGYPNTSGLPGVAFHITDHYAETEDGTKYTEDLLYMPDTFLCFGTQAPNRRVLNTPAEQNGFITFGSFNNVSKLNPPLVHVFSNILKQVPGSKLTIKAKGYDDLTRKNILREFQQNGIDETRIVSIPFAMTFNEHITRYNEIDIALDTFPYNGTTTTCEALLMGVPVVTCVGRMHAQRVCYSILKNIGLIETIADSPEEYVKKAIQLSKDTKYLTVLRQRIPTMLQSSTLCQPETFTRNIENLYVEAFEKHSKQPRLSNSYDRVANISTGSRTIEQESIRTAYKIKKQKRKAEKSARKKGQKKRK